MNISDKKNLAFRTALIAGIFSSIVSVVMILNYWQLKRTDPLESEALKSLVEQLDKDYSNEALKEDIRRLDLMTRKAYFTKQWQIRTGAYLLVVSAIILVIALKMYHSYTSKIEPPQSGEESMLLEVLTSHRWVLYTILAIFGASLFASILSNNHLSKTYVLTENHQDNDGPPVQEIITKEQAAEAIKTNAISTTDENNQRLVSAIVDEQDVKTTPDSTKESTNENKEVAAKTEAAVSSSSQTSASNPFPSFRGKNGLGISTHKNLPIDWDGATGKNILWKSAIPSPGYNSPVIWGDRLFLTGADNTSQMVYCYNKNTGEILWQHPVNDIKRPAGKVRKPTDDTGYAAPTVTTDGRLVFAIFASGDVACVSVEGKRVWSKNIGIPDNHYGHSSSLLLWEGLLLIQFDTNETGRVLALDKETGGPKWDTSRNTQISWSSPILAKVGDRYELILTSSPLVAAYDPASGEELWGLECLMGEVGPSAGFSNGIVFAANEYANLVAIKPGSTPEIIWESNEYLPEVSSLVVDAGMVFISTSYGVIASFDAKTGEIVWEYEGDQGFYASPMIADGKVFFLDLDGIMHIFALDKTMKLLGTPPLGESTVSTPAFTDGRIYLRSAKFLYCIGEK